jgi:hypothetical protein
MGKLLIFLLGATAATCLGQAPGHLSPFTLSKVPGSLEYQLPSNVVGRVELATPSIGLDVSVPTSTTQFEVQTASEMQARLDVICTRLERMDLGGYLFHRSQTSDNRIVNALNNIFEPEVIRIGKISASATPITAWKRKNPLCLLNPMVVDFSW